MYRALSLLAALAWAAFSSIAHADVTVSNGPNSNNSDYVTCTDLAGGCNAQRVKLLDPTPGSTAGIGISSNPLWCTVQGVSSETTLQSLLTELAQKTEPANTQSVSGTVAATQSGTWNITNISGIVALPTGAATSSLQTTGNSSLSSIDTKTPALISGRTPVDGSGVTQPVSASSLPLPTGASTSALQSTGNSSLSSIDSKITSCDTGDVTIGAGLPTGTNHIGDVSLQPRASSSGWDKKSSLDIDSTAFSIKGSAGKLGGYYIYNNASATTYCKVYDRTSVNPATDVPDMRLTVPSQAAANLSDPNGIGFTTGILIRCVSGVADSNTGDPGANAIVASFWYK